jgi:hypothetical protein
MAQGKNTARMVIGRTLAVFVASGLSVVGAGSVVGVELWKSVVIAGVSGVVTVLQGLSRAFMKDGNLSSDEIEAVFAEVDKQD